MYTHAINPWKYEIHLKITYVATDKANVSQEVCMALDMNVAQEYSFYVYKEPGQYEVAWLRPWVSSTWVSVFIVH